MLNKPSITLFVFPFIVFAGYIHSSEPEKMVLIPSGSYYPLYRSSAHADHSKAGIEVDIILPDYPLSFSVALMHIKFTRIRSASSPKGLET